MKNSSSHSLIQPKEIITNIRNYIDSSGHRDIDLSDVGRDLEFNLVLFIIV